MASRTDQLHSYQFSAQRVVSALVLREPDPAQSPGRRLAGATMAGILLAALSLAGVAVYGLLTTGGSTDWRTSQTVIVEKETGARYVYLDQTLYPVLNYASARLLVGGEAGLTTVTAKQLAQVARGAPVGIPGAPDSLPGQGSLLGDGWSVCSARPTGDGAAGAPGSVLFVGSAPGGGRQLAEQGVLGQTPDGTRYLIWHATALRIPRWPLVQSAFSWGGETPVPLAPALVSALVGGPDLTPTEVPELGQSSTRLTQYRIGTVLVSQRSDGVRQYGVVLGAGLAPISQVQADLLLADPDVAHKVGRGTAVEIAQSEYAQLPPASLPDPTAALPRTTPELARPGAAAAVCTTAPVAGAGTVTVDAGVDAVRGVVTAGGGLADRIVVPAGRGALVESVASATASGGALSLVTDVGRRYPLPTVQVAGLLGYADRTPVRVPAALVAMLPAGPVLDPAAARQPA